MSMLKHKKNKDEVTGESSLAVTELTASRPYVPESKKPKKDNTHWLYIGVIIAVIAGIIFGITAPDIAKEFIDFIMSAEDQAILEKDGYFSETH